jgi:hypothetical protein
VPRRTRSTRARGRSTRPLPDAATAVAESPVATEPSRSAPAASILPPIAAGRTAAAGSGPGAGSGTTTARRHAAPVPRGFITDYGFIIGELRRTIVITAIILAGMLALWFVLPH